MSATRLVILLGILGGLTVFVVQNTSPSLPLVFLGVRTVTLPLSIWILMGIAAGLLTSLAISFILQWRQPQRQPQRRSSPATEPRDRTSRQTDFAAQPPHNTKENRGTSASAETPQSRSKPIVDAAAYEVKRPFNLGKEPDTSRQTRSNDDWEAEVKPIGDWENDGEETETPSRRVSPPDSSRNHQEQQVYAAASVDPPVNETTWDDDDDDWMEDEASDDDASDDSWIEDDWVETEAESSENQIPPSGEKTAGSRNIYEVKQKPKIESWSGSIYSYGYRESADSGVGKTESVYDADYRILTPPYREATSEEGEKTSSDAEADSDLKDDES